MLEGIYIESTASCFGEINGQIESENNIDIIDNNSDKDDVLSRKDSIRSRSITGSWPNLTEENLKHITLSEDSTGHSRNPSEIDSLDSNYVRKHYNFEAHLNNYKDSSPETEHSCEISTADNQIYFNKSDKDLELETHQKINYESERSFTNDSISITHSDKHNANENTIDRANDVDSYDEISIKSQNEITSINIENKVLSQSREEITKEIDIQSIQSEHDGNVSSPPDSITSYISISIPSSTDKSHKLEYLANSLAEKIDEYCESQFKENLSIKSQNITITDNKPTHDNNPIYTKVNKIKLDSNKENVIKITDNYIKASQPNQNDTFVSNTYIEREETTARNNQRYFGSSKNITTEPFVTTLIENQYYSLPDINISKCLRKSERIDAQLREEDPEDVPCENTYEIAQTHFLEILSNKGTENYGQINTNQYKNSTNINVNEIKKETEDYKEPYLIQNFTRLEDDLKSIVTVNSSNLDEKEYEDCNDTQQNEREINEIEGTIRNNKIITKSESLKLSSGYRFKDNNLYISVSNDKINQLTKDKKTKPGIRKHYSLRQREPNDEEINRLPSPATVERTIKRPAENSKTFINESIINKSQSLLSRVQSFKTNAESNITIVPLSGHQTIIINPPLTTKNESQTKTFCPQDVKPPLEISNSNKITEDSAEIKKCLIKPSVVDTSSYCTPKDPFITIKLNKVVKTTIPKLKKETSDKIALVQNKFEKPPPRLIIKDNKSKENLIPDKKIASNNMTRPQVMQVIDSKTVKQNQNKAEELNKNTPKEIVQKMNNVKLQRNDDVTDHKVEIVSVKEKINNAIKTDIEYQEKLHSVKNYWTRLIDKTPEEVKHDKVENKEEVKPKLDIKNKDEEIANKDETNSDENKSNFETTVGNIIKSIESVKIVDSIRKISQTKLQLWKDESEKVKDDSEVEETLVKKIVKDCEENITNESNAQKLEKCHKKTELELCNRDTPEIEIVELSSDDNKNQTTQATLIKAKGYEKGCDDFDHVRYKVMKSELFKNSMIANYRKKAQFDGLLQYLQDYSFQELLVNNNIVIIEPVRTKIEPPRKNLNANTCKISPSLLKKNENNPNQLDRTKSTVRKHFFYHPIRVNKEIIEEELPNPDTVKKVRNLFEDTLKMRTPMIQDPPIIDESGLSRRATSHKNLNEDSKENKSGFRKKVIRQLTIDTSFSNKKWDNVSLSSGVSSGDLSSNNEYETDGLSPYSHKNLKDHVYSSSSEEYLCDSVSHDFCCESQYVSPDILKKIRDCGTSITYYGGKVLNSKTGSTVSPMTKAIMEEIKGLQKNCSRDCYLCQTKCRGDKCSCLVADQHKPKYADNKQHSSTSSDSGNHDPDKAVKRNDSFPGFKFKLVKSNSCSSRLELTGTDESKNPRYKFRKTFSTEDPPLVTDDENSVKNKICRLESYNKGIAKTPFENKEEESFIKNKILQPTITKDEIKKIENTRQEQKVLIVKPTVSETKLSNKETEESNINALMDKTDSHTFEKKFYYINENLNQNKTTTGKFGEMVFEEFEVLESCYNSLNSNKSTK